MHPKVHSQLIALGEQVHQLADMMEEECYTTSTLRMIQKCLFDHAVVFKGFVDVQEKIDLEEMHKKVNREFYA